MARLGEVERHYLLCPYCGLGRQDLDTRECSVCGAKPVAILWERDEERVSPELVMVGRTYYVSRFAA